MLDSILDFFNSLFDIWHWSNVLILPGLLIGFTVHELGHAVTAYFLGDMSQVQEGKITIGPLKHISWLGIFTFIVFNIGWPKPLQFQHDEFENRYLDSFLVAMAGPVANFVFCLIAFIISAVLLGILVIVNQLDSEQFSAIFLFTRNSPLAKEAFFDAIQNPAIWLVTLTNRIWVANFVLAAASLIPLPPFDGFTIVLSIAGLFNKDSDDKNKFFHSMFNTNATKDSPDSEFVTSPSQKNVADIHFNIGLEYHNEQKYDDAIARYRQALRADSTYGPAYVNMGLAYKAKNQPNEAMQSFQAAIDESSDPDWLTLAIGTIVFTILFIGAFVVSVVSFIA
ncbi:MAG: hypothetical protein B6242_04115 [Anaerolineaceae bacterium 4572_78]|nr:MAG: hypothetical protein B6242_04115 [Anaerolineaceae bacterium 4572_78]